MLARLDGYALSFNARMRPLHLEERTCPYCGKQFKPPRSHQDQKVCSSDDCQRRRRTEYHRRRLNKDPLYRALCEDSQKTWKQRNPNYMKQYRASQRQAKLGRSGLRPAARELERLLSHVKNTLVKNTSAFQVKRCAPALWHVGPKEVVADENTLLPTQVIVIQGITVGEQGKGGREQRSGNRGRSDV